MIDLSRDSILYDQEVDSAIGYVRKVSSESAIPNTLKTRKEYDGFFIQRIEASALEGPLLFDPHLASYVDANYENFSDIKNDIFVCVVYVPKLHHIPKDSMPAEPSGEEYNLLLDRLMSSGRGVFKKYDYAGEDPAYMAPVKVSFADTDGYTDPIFETPLAGGAARAPAPGAGGGFGGQRALNNCNNIGGSNLSVGATKRKKNSTPVRSAEEANKGLSQITVNSAANFLNQPSTLTLQATDGILINLNFQPDAENSNTAGSSTSAVTFEANPVEVDVGIKGLTGENQVVNYLKDIVNSRLSEKFTADVLSLKSKPTSQTVNKSGPATNSPALRTKDCDVAEYKVQFSSNAIGSGGKNKDIIVYKPKDFNPKQPINVMIWFHGLGGSAASRSATVIDKGPGIPAGDNRIFIVPKMPNPPYKMKVLASFLDETLQKMYEGYNFNAGDIKINSIRSFGWSAGGDPQSMFMIDVLQNSSFGFDKVKSVRYLDADYGDKQHVQFAEKLNDPNKWKQVVSFVVSSKVSDKRPLEYSWAGSKKKGKKDRHDLVYPEGTQIVVYNTGHTQCGWQTGDLLYSEPVLKGNIPGGAQVASQTSNAPSEAKLKIVQKIAGESGNTEIKFNGDGLNITKFAGGKNVEQKKSSEASSDAPNPAGEKKVPSNKQKQQEVPAPKPINPDLKAQIDEPFPSGALPIDIFNPRNPIHILKGSNALGNAIESNIIKLLEVTDHYTMAESVLATEEISNLDIGLVETPRDTPLIIKAAGTLVLRLETIAAQTPPPQKQNAPGAPAAAPAPKKPSSEEVSDNTPKVGNINNSSTSAPGNPCASGFSLGPGGGASLGQVGPGGYPAADPSAYIDENGYVGKGKAYRELVATGRMGNLNKGGWGLKFPVGGPEMFEAYTTGQKSVDKKLKPVPVEELNTVYDITAEYMRKDAADALNAVGKELRSKGCLLFFDSTSRALGVHKSGGKRVSCHGLNIAVDLNPTSCMADPDKDIYVAAPDFVNDGGSLYWRIYARSVGFSGIDGILQRGSGHHKTALKQKNDWYFADSVPPNQVPVITIPNAAYIRRDPSTQVGKVWFRPVTGPFIDLTEIMQRHGYLPIGCHDSKSNDPFWDFSRQKMKEIVAANGGQLPQGLTTNNFRGCEWWHFDFLKNTTKDDTVAGDLNKLKKGGRAAWKAYVLKQAKTSGTKWAKAAQNMQKTPEQFADWWINTVYDSYGRLKATLKKGFKKYKGIDVYTTYY